MEPEELLLDLKKTVEGLSKQESLAEDRIKAYNYLQRYNQNDLMRAVAFSTCFIKISTLNWSSVFKLGSQNEKTLEFIIENAQMLCESFVREITCKKEDPNTPALSAALQVLGVCLRNDPFTRYHNRIFLMTFILLLTRLQLQPLVLIQNISESWTMKFAKISFAVHFYRS